MTLLLAVILIHGFQLHPLWIFAAVITWVFHLIHHASNK